VVPTVIATSFNVLYMSISAVFAHYGVNEMFTKHAV